MAEISPEQANGIYDTGACLKLIIKENISLINKGQVRTIDIVRGDTIRIDIGQGALKNVYIRPNDMDYPLGVKSVSEFRDYIGGLMVQLTGDGSNLMALQVKLLDAINRSWLGNLLANSLPSREDESQPSVVYRGFAMPGANPGDSVWAIVRITRTNNQVLYDWADGNENYDNIWDNRYELVYDIAQVVLAR